MRKRVGGVPIWMYLRRRMQDFCVVTTQETVHEVRFLKEEGFQELYVEVCAREADGFIRCVVATQAVPRRSCARKETGPRLRVGPAIFWTHLLCRDDTDGKDRSA